MEIEWSAKLPDLVVGIVSGLVVLVVTLLPRGWRWKKKWAAKYADEIVGQANAIGGDAARYLVRVAETVMLALDAILSLSIGIMFYLLSTGAAHWWSLILHAITGSLVGRSLVCYYFFQKEVRVAKHAVRNQTGDEIKKSHEQKEDDQTFQ